MAGDRDIDLDVHELDGAAHHPGTYFNPQTEVVVIVDDSASLDRELFDDGDFEGSEWVRISDEAPIDEAGLEEAIESFETRHRAGPSIENEDPEDPEEELEPDPDPED